MTQRTLARAVNSVIGPDVDVTADVVAINRGDAERHGNTYIVHGRRNGVESSGRVYPIDGLGVFQLERGAFKALGVYNRFGRSEHAEWILDRMDVEPAAREAARHAWRVANDRNEP